MKIETKLTAMITGLNVLLSDANEIKTKCLEEKDYAGYDSIQEKINEMYAEKIQYEKELSKITAEEAK